MEMFALLSIGLAFLLGFTLNPHLTPEEKQKLWGDIKHDIVRKKSKTSIVSPHKLGQKNSLSEEFSDKL